MEEVTQYSRYQQPLKKMCIVQIIFSLMTVLTIVFLVFLPNFKMAINSEVMQANITLPKLYDAEIWAQILTQANTEINFSVFDELYAIVKPAGEAAVGVTYVSGIFHIFGAVFLFAGVTIALISLFRNIANVTSIENYAIEMFDVLKNRHSGIKTINGLNSASWFIGGVVYEIMAVFLSSFLSRIYGEKTITSYFTNLSGLSAVGFLTVIMVLVTMGISVYLAQIKRKIKISVLRDEYLFPRNR